MRLPFRASAQAPRSFVIVGADVADGSGAPLVRANVRVSGDLISRVGSFVPDAGETVLDGKGLVLAPGFIDTHNHSDRNLETNRLAESQISQGLTTLLLGQDGSSAWPIGEWLDKFRKAVRDIPEIVDFYRMSGEIDYLLKAYVPDIASYDELYKKLISRVELSDVTSMFAMEELKSTTEIPLTFHGQNQSRKLKR